MAGTYKDFKGDDDLTGIQSVVAQAFLQNELGGVSDGYQLSHAGIGKSGFSFGGNQMDLSTNEKYSDTIKDILVQAKDADGKPIVADSESFYARIAPALESVGKPDAISDEDKKIINSGLSSPYGRQKIDEEFKVEVDTRIAHTMSVLEHLPDGARKTKIMNSPELLTHIVDYDNRMDFRRYCKRMDFNHNHSTQPQQ
jgi:hypothetical protein